MIKVKNLTKKYNNSHDSEEGVFDISFEVNQGEVVAIMGPSGSGKSTLLKLLSGLYKPEEGSFSFDAEESFGYVSQEYTLWPHLNVIENLTLAPSLKSLKGNEEIMKKALELLERFGLEKYKNSHPHDLSGGQKQRVALLRSLMMKPKILFLDEITSSLDPEITKSVLDLVRTLANDGYTMLIVTHHVSFAKSVADRVLFLKNGRVLSYDKADAFFVDQSNKEIKSFITDIIHEYNN